MPVSVTSIAIWLPSSRIAIATRSCAVRLAPFLALLLDRLDPVLDDVGQRLAELAAVADQERRRLGRVEREGDVGMGDLVQEQGLAGDLGDRFLAEDRLGHAREGGEFVDHPPKVADLADDRPGQLLEGAGIGADLLAVAPLEPLGGELDRGQRVLDLVGDAAGDVGPGGAALVEQLLGDVVEGEDVAALDLHPSSPRACAARRREANWMMSSRSSPSSWRSSSGASSASLWPTGSGRRS